MQRVNQRYAQLHNQRRGGSGKLFEQRFHSEPVESDHHLMFCVLYINANPHAAMLPKRQAYPWSSQAVHCGTAKPTSSIAQIVDLDPWYRGLGATKAERADAYIECFEEYLAGKRNEAYLERAQRLEPGATSGSRLERPDGSSAAETISHYAVDGQQSSRDGA